MRGSGGARLCCWQALRRLDRPATAREVAEVAGFTPRMVRQVLPDVATCRWSWRRTERTRSRVRLWTARAQPRGVFIPNTSEHRAASRRHAAKCLVSAGDAGDNDGETP